MIRITKIKSINPFNKKFIRNIETSSIGAAIFSLTIQLIPIGLVILYDIRSQRKINIKNKNELKKMKNDRTELLNLMRKNEIEIQNRKELLNEIKYSKKKMKI